MVQASRILAPSGQAGDNVGHGVGMENPDHFQHWVVSAELRKALACSVLKRTLSLHLSWVIGHFISFETAGYLGKGLKFSL